MLRIHPSGFFSRLFRPANNCNSEPLLPSPNGNNSSTYTTQPHKPIYIHGGRPLTGEVTIGGSKHSILHILGALLLVSGETEIDNFPNIDDARHMLSIFESFGLQYQIRNNALFTCLNHFRYNEEELHRATFLKSSILLLGGALLRNSHIKIPVPGGDDFGNEANSIFLNILKEFGITATEKEGHIIASLSNPLKGDREIGLNDDLSG